jgi:hypothetical protein
VRYLFDDLSLLPLPSAQFLRLLLDFLQYPLFRLGDYVFHVKAVAQLFGANPAAGTVLAVGRRLAIGVADCGQTIRRQFLYLQL